MLIEVVDPSCRDPQSGMCACLSMCAHTSPVGRSKWSWTIIRLTIIGPFFWLGDLIVSWWCSYSLFSLSLIGWISIFLPFTVGVIIRMYLGLKFQVSNLCATSLTDSLTHSLTHSPLYSDVPGPSGIVFTHRYPHKILLEDQNDHLQTPDWLRFGHVSNLVVHMQIINPLTHSFTHTLFYWITICSLTYSVH